MRLHLEKTLAKLDNCFLLSNSSNNSQVNMIIVL